MPLYATESRKETPEQKRNRDAVSWLMTGEEDEAWYDAVFVPTRGQLIKLKSMQRRLYVKNEAGEWVYHTVDDMLNIVEVRHNAVEV